MVTVVEYQKAEREYTVREKRRGFRAHAVVYAVVMPILIVVNLVVIATTDGDFLWFPFPLIGWGLGLLNHYLWGVRWVERDIATRQEMITAEVGGPGAARRT